MKGQASLEMVVGLIILLVVAAVVISLVIFYITPERMPNPGGTLSVTQFKDNCKSSCAQKNAMEYCGSFYDGDDWNANGIKDELVKVGTYEWYTCEKKVYCFLAVPCDEYGPGMIGINRCKQLLCQTYLEKYPTNATRAGEALMDKVNVGSCDYTLLTVPAEDDWYATSFALGC